MIKPLKEVAYYYYVKDAKTGMWTDISCLPKEQQGRLCQEAYQKLAEGFGCTREEKNVRSEVSEKSPQE